MKTGRVRPKEKPPAEELPTTPPVPPAPTPPQPAAEPARPAGPAIPTFAIVLGILGCLVLAVVLAITLGGRRTEEWVKVSRASGEWLTTVTVFGPQVNTQERWEADCLNDPRAVVRTGTCILRDSSTYNDRVVDEYDEYAYNIYYEENHEQVYEASGAEFVATQLKTDDWWQENLHYVLTEEVDRESCKYTNYTVWVDDPQDSTQEIEVYLSDCEVWDHVTVHERVYEQAMWCQCDVTTLVQVGQQAESGSGADVGWASLVVPTGGSTERAFQGQVTFLGEDYTYTVTTQDLAEYQGYLTGQYYLSIRNGKAVSVSNNPPK